MIVEYRENSQSGAMLAEALKDFDSPRALHWGTIGNGINGEPSLTGLEQLIAFQNAGLLYPEFTNDLTVAKSWPGVVFGRNFHHTRGQDIVGSRHRAWKYRDYWVKFVPSLEEWRIHVYKGRVIARGVKVSQGPHWRKLLVRSRSNNWYLDHSKPSPEGIWPFACTMAKACNYTFAACDILITLDNKFCALECNRAPGMDQYTLSRYVKAIKERPK